MAAKKKQVQEEVISFPDEYIVFAADLSLNRPGFCSVVINKKDGVPVIEGVAFHSIDNKKSKKKKRGQILGDIFEYLVTIAWPKKYTVYFVREKSVNSFGGGDSASSKTAVGSVVGIADFALYANRLEDWHEIYPVTVKKLITGHGRAEKDEVAKCLEAYIGKQEYACDDESDAAAVAIAWLIQQKQIKQIDFQEEPNNAQEERLGADS